MTKNGHEVNRQENLVSCSTGRCDVAGNFTARLYQPSPLLRGHPIREDLYSIFLVLLFSFCQPAWSAEPIAFTQPAMPVTTNRATLNGMVVPNGFATAVWFEWGPRGAYAYATSPSAIGSGGAVVHSSAEVAGLAPRADYQYRVVASNSLGVVFGAIQLFSTGKRVWAWGANGDGRTRLPAGLGNVVAIAAGYAHSVALKTDNTIAVWGVNDSGQTYISPYLTNAIAVAAGTTHSLALQPDGRPVGWGNNSGGQLNVPWELSNAVAIACGSGFSLALKADGIPLAWGGNYFGPTNIPRGLSNVVAVACGNNHSLALLADGTVEAWGDNRRGQTSVPLTLSKAVAIAGGESHSLALKADGTVVAWGANDYGQTNVPLDLTNIVAISAGSFHNLALRADGTLVGWGNTFAGLTIAPPLLSNAVALAGGGYHNLAMGDNVAPQADSQVISAPANQDRIISPKASDANGDALNWRITSLPTAGTLYQYSNYTRGSAITAPGTVIGDPLGRVVFVPETNRYGNAYASFTYVANDADADSPPASITLDIGLSRAFTQKPTKVLSDRAVLNGIVLPNGFGSIAWFEWGPRGGYDHATLPLSLGKGSSAVRISSEISGLAAHEDYQCRIVMSNLSGVVYGGLSLFTTGKRAVAWGANYYGQTNVPANLADVVAVACGSFHALALKANGTVTAWGHSMDGRTNVPPTLSNVVAVAGGGTHSLALTAEGNVVAWGYNGYGQASVPWDLRNVVAIDAGENHSLAITAEGRVVAWGSNSHGQNNVPPEATNVVEVAAGYYHSLARRGDGSIVVWGGMGDGETNVPSGVTSTTAIAVGGSRNLALQADGRLEIWGGSSQTNIPVGLSNLVAIAAGLSHNIGIVANAAPTAIPQLLSTAANEDQVIALSGSDPERDDLRFRIMALPSAGTLYQYDSGSRGSAIMAPGTLVTDAGGRVIFAPTPDEFGNPYSHFEFAATDGEAESFPAAVTVATGAAHAFTQPATLVSIDSMNLHGMVNPNGLETIAWFEWGARGTYSESTSPSSIGNGSMVIRMTREVGGLLPRTDYQCRIAASNAVGVTYGAVQLFTTGKKVPRIAWPSGPMAKSSRGGMIIVARPMFRQI